MDITLIYYDQRIRLEGYDIERMLDAAGMNGTEQPAQSAGLETAVLEETQG